MDEISSAEFRKVYSKLVKPMVVTANGHPIGQWLPASYPITVTFEQSEGTVTIDPPPMKGQVVAIHATHRPPFTPAPKKGQRPRSLV